MANDVQLPRNVEMEQFVLGALLLSESPEQVLEARDSLPADAFMVGTHYREIWNALGEMAKDGDSINPVTLQSRLLERGSKVTPADIAALYDGVPRFSNGSLQSEFKTLRDLATRRAALRHANSVIIEAQQRNCDVEALVRRAQEMAADLDASAWDGDVRAFLSASWADFDLEEFQPGEHIAFAVERREIALLNALPDAGKTTLALNVALCLAAGREFPPLVTGRTPRRVLYIDGETTSGRLQRDLRVMTKGFSKEEAMAVGRNLRIICEAEIKGEPLALTDAAHLLALSAEAARLKPDFIVVDTLASLCPLYSENDNGEQGRRIWRPLQKFARDCDAAMLVNHHIGVHSEGGQSRPGVYRGRGASASGAHARAVWNLTPDASAPGVVKLACAKAKCEKPAAVVLTHNRETRWMDAGQAAPAPPSTYVRVVGVFNGKPLGVTDVKALLPDLSKPTIERTIKSAVDRGDLENPKRGKYQKPVSITSITPIGDDGSDGNSEPADIVGDSRDLWDEGEISINGTGADEERRFLDAMAE